MKAPMYIVVLVALLAGCTSPKNGGQTSTTPASSSGGNAVTMKSALLSWSASATASGYQILQSNDGVTYAAVTTTTSTSVLVGNLTSGTTYYFEVKAYNGGGYSPASSVVTLHP